MSADRRATPGNGRLPRTRTTRWIGLGLVAVVGAVALELTLSRAPKGDVTVSGAVALGQPAPDITMTDFEGERFELSDYEGKPLVVNFWASWCPNCVAEMPEFENVHQATAGEIGFLGINQSDARGPAEDLARATGVTYRLAVDPQGEIFQVFGAPGMPATVLIDAWGNVVDVVVGQLSKDALTEYIERSFPSDDGG
jgi:peroxiredoxin